MGGAALSLPVAERSRGCTGAPGRSPAEGHFSTLIPYSFHTSFTSKVTLVMPPLQDCDDPVTGIVAELEAAGATIKYGIDAAHLRQTLQVGVTQ